MHERALLILKVLRRSAAPLSGREVADVVGLAPNTAISHLKQLRADGLAVDEHVGRAHKWTSTADAALVDLPAEPTHERVALVVTAVDLEFTAVRKRLLNAERVRAVGTWLIRGEVVGDGITWTVFLAQSGMGNATSAALVAYAAGNLGANLVCFVGTAGGLKPDDHRHGDVVIASRIHNPYAGKQVPGPGDGATELLGRDKTYSVPVGLQSLVNAAIQDSIWSPSQDAPTYDPRHSHAYLAPVVAVESVQTDPSGPVPTEIRRRFQDAAALDMESYGLAAGSDIHDLPILVVRGLSDFLGDKRTPGNDAAQPLAADNAARFLASVLTYAHPDDFNRGHRDQFSTPPPAGNLRDDDTNSSHGLTANVESALPASTKTWMNRLRHASPSRAKAALRTIAELRDSGATPATWLNRTLHRPPTWLREDDTGDAWMLCTSLAGLADSKATARGYARAAAAAALGDAPDVSAYYLLCSALIDLDTQARTAAEATTEPATEDDNPAWVAPANRAPELEAALPPDVRVRLGPLLDFYRAVLDGSLREVRDAAGRALPWLGHPDQTGVLTNHHVKTASPDLDEEIRRIIASALLQQLARMLLAPGSADEAGDGPLRRTSRGNPVLRDLADDALVLARRACALRPGAEGSLLTQGQCLLAVMISMTGRTRDEVDLEVSRWAKQVEADALHVRDIYRDWHGQTGPALAVAARARSMRGDLPGALRLLTAAPDGLATRSEARHPDVSRLAAFFAAATGQGSSALDLLGDSPDPVEAQYTRATVLDDDPLATTEANHALLEALDLAGDDTTRQFQSLMALTRRFATLTPTEQATVRARVTTLGTADPDLADLLEARTRLAEGHPEEALVLLRGMGATELVIAMRTDALEQLDRAEEAVEELAREGRARHDAQMLLGAMEVAERRGLSQHVRSVAGALIAGDYSDGARRHALRSLRRMARLEGDWSEVITLTDRLAEDANLNDLPIPESEHWMRIEALYFAGRYQQAVEVLADPDRSLTFNQREKALLLFSVLRRADDDRRGPSRPVLPFDSGGELFDRFMQAAREWAHDEELAALALSLTMLSPGVDLTEAQVLDVRRYATEYFERHGDRASIRQIDVGENFDQLTDLLRESNDRSRSVDEVARSVLMGNAPLSLLSFAAGRPYAETLIRRDLGLLIAVGLDGDDGLDAASSALDRSVVVDTSALVTAPLTGVALRRLVACFDSVVIPEPLYDDIERARRSLALRSTASLGWDPREQRPFITEIPDDTAERFAGEADQLWLRTRTFETATHPALADVADPLIPVVLARETNRALWADDVALRQIARAEGVPAFGTLDLLYATGSEAPNRHRVDADMETVEAALRENRVVDLPIPEPWHQEAEGTGWEPTSLLAAQLARPHAWTDPQSSVNQFRELLRHRPTALPAETVAAWVYPAATGLAHATHPTARSHVVAVLLVIALTETDPIFAPARLLGIDTDTPDAKAAGTSEAILTVAQRLAADHYPDSDPVRAVVFALVTILSEVLDTRALHDLITEWAATIPAALGQRVFAAFTQTAGSK